MRVEKLSAFARPLVLGTAIVLFVDLFLDWRVASVTTPAVSTTAGASGWGGWGVVAGILLAALIVWELRLLRRGPEELRDVTISTALALGAAGFVVVAFLTGSVSVEVGGVVAVSTEEIRWPGYAGLVLAGLLVLAAVARHVVEARAHPAPPRTTAHGAV